MVYDVDSIKQRNSIADIVAKHGVVLRDSGAHLVGLCPFHQDEHPSFAVYPDTRSFYCFGCNAGGDVIDFVRRADNLSFRDALERLNNGEAPTPSIPPRSEALSLDDRMILTAATAVYHETLLRAPAAVRYLETRGIGLSVVRRCRIGYSDGRSLRPYLQRHRLSIKRATEMGLFWAKGARGETMAGRIVVPEQRSGQCVWMLGRVMDDERQPKYRGLSLPKPILGYEGVRGRPRVFVTEGAFDYLTGVAWGLPMCALLGTHVRAERLSFLQRARRVLIVFDNDAPGREAAANLAQSVGARARVITLPEGIKDLSDLAVVPHGRATFFQLVKDADRGEASADEA
ncbi:MAG: CHC2 zinc finger domain-containing protein [Dehalococcoidia bacterium]